LTVKPYLFEWLVATTLLIAGCRSPWEVIRPVIHEGDGRIAAIKSAPTILLVEIQHTKLFTKPREVEKPPTIGGPMVPRIPLYLAEISAKVLRTMRGAETGHIKFYSWVWASGKHGGPRLFHPLPGSIHVLFLKEDSGFLHTVGDYPNYDLEIRSASLPRFLADWDAGYGLGEDLIERIVGVGLNAELESIPQIPVNFGDFAELEELTSPPFMTRQLDSICHGLTSSIGRTEACAAFAQRISSH
jgi:hypothetical protein